MRRQIKIPPLLLTTIPISISSINGMEFTTRGPCPHCGGRPIGYDTKKKIFAEMLTHRGKKVIHVYVKRFKCRECGRLLYADEPFYPGTRTASVVIDLALSLSQQYSYSHTAKIMHALGFSIDRGSVRSFANSTLPLQKMNIMYGMHMPNTFVTLISKLLVPGTAKPEDVLDACGYPSQYTVPEDLHGTAIEYTRNHDTSDEN